MNKNVLGVLAAVLLLAGCGRDEEPAPAVPPPPASPPVGVPAEPPPPPLPGESATPPAEPATPPAEPGTPPADQPPPPTAPQSEAPPAPDTPASAAAGSDAATGESVYKRTCAVCHAAGVAGAPKPGDKADWSPRIAQGMDVLQNHALNGFQGQKGVMPPKGGNTSLPDDDVRAAVEYMVAQSR